MAGASRLLRELEQPPGPASGPGTHWRHQVAIWTRNPDTLDVLAHRDT
jgi:hypothetical protein